MNQEDTTVRVTLRIPGNWAHPGELIERMPAGFRLTPEALLLPDGTEIELTPMPPDDQFAQIFRSSCRQPAEDDELEIVDGYTVNIGLTGPGGSMAAALAMMQAGAAIVRAGGAGVFIDNSGVAHGGRKWIEMTEDGGPDAVSFAFVGMVRNRQEVWTIGMHVMGLPDIVMRRADVEPDGDTIIEVLDSPGVALAFGATFAIYAGCDKRFETCRAKFANTLNFRGFPHMPGNDAVQSRPVAGEPMDGGSRYS